MNNEQKINAWFQNFAHRMDERVPGIIAETATEYYKERFLFKNWDGKPWPKFNPSNKPGRREPTRGSLMMRTNNLFASIRPSVVSRERIRMSAGSGKVNYARVHNEGLRVAGVQSVRPFTNTNFMGKGQRVQIKGHSRKVNFQMPRRQFIGHSAILNRRIIQRLKLAFKT